MHLVQKTTTNSLSKNKATQPRYCFRKERVAKGFTVVQSAGKRELDHEKNLSCALNFLFRKQTVLLDLADVSTALTLSLSLLHCIITLLE
ncbi:hypothetical protein CDAR_201341 [Caerostris darwini]|uniref:Uncharacterized protein n=1 Tax=Caerostris darwini TaxID=1538125 RepID=A0AAV4S0X7_9ARAC|nr:hypothetical protein CDAR_201341 [Caerostris darwini]